VNPSEEGRIAEQEQRGEPKEGEGVRTARKFRKKRFEEWVYDDRTKIRGDHQERCKNVTGSMSWTMSEEG